MRTRHACAALLLAVALGGCGGGDRLSKDEYEQKVQAAGEDLEQAFGALDADPSNLPELQRATQQAREELRQQIGELEDIEPPEDIEEEHDDLVRGLDALADALGKIEQAAETRNAAKVAQAVQGIGDSPAIEEADRATRSMKQKGYEIGELGESG